MMDARVARLRSLIGDVPAGIELVICAGPDGAGRSRTLDSLEICWNTEDRSEGSRPWTLQRHRFEATLPAIEHGDQRWGWARGLPGSLPLKAPMALLRTLVQDDLPRATLLLRSLFSRAPDFAAYLRGAECDLPEEVYPPPWQSASSPARLLPRDFTPLIAEAITLLVRERGRLLWILEDAQYMEPATRLFLGDLITHVGNASSPRIVVVLTTPGPAQLQTRRDPGHWSDVVTALAGPVARHRIRVREQYWLSADERGVHEEPTLDSWHDGVWEHFKGFSPFERALASNIVIAPTLRMLLRFSKADEVAVLGEICDDVIAEIRELCDGEPGAHALSPQARDLARAVLTRLVDRVGGDSDRHSPTQPTPILRGWREVPVQAIYLACLVRRTLGALEAKFPETETALRKVLLREWCSGVGVANDVAFPDGEALVLRALEDGGWLRREPTGHRFVHDAVRQAVWERYGSDAALEPNVARGLHRLLDLSVRRGAWSEARDLSARVRIEDAALRSRIQEAIARSSPPLEAPRSQLDDGAVGLLRHLVWYGGPEPGTRYPSRLDHDLVTETVEGELGLALPRKGPAPPEIFREVRAMLDVASAPDKARHGTSNSAALERRASCAHLLFASLLMGELPSTVDSLRTIQHHLHVARDLVAEGDQTLAAHHACLLATHLYVVSATAIWTGEAPPSDEVAHRAANEELRTATLALARRFRDGFAEGALHACHAFVLLHDRELHAALTATMAAERRLRESGYVAFLCEALLLRAAVLLRLHDRRGFADTTAALRAAATRLRVKRFFRDVEYGQIYQEARGPSLPRTLPRVLGASERRRRPHRSALALLGTNDEHLHWHVVAAWQMLRSVEAGATRELLALCLSTIREGLALSGVGASSGGGAHNRSRRAPLVSIVEGALFAAEVLLCAMLPLEGVEQGANPSGSRPADTDWTSALGLVKDLLDGWTRVPPLLRAQRARVELGWAVLSGPPQEHLLPTKREAARAECAASGGTDMALFHLWSAWSQLLPLQRGATSSVELFETDPYPEPVEDACSALRLAEVEARKVGAFVVADVARAVCRRVERRYLRSYLSQSARDEPLAKDYRSTFELTEGMQIHAQPRPQILAGLRRAIESLDFAEELGLVVNGSLRYWVGRIPVARPRGHESCACAEGSTTDALDSDLSLCEPLSPKPKVGISAQIYVRKVADQGAITLAEKHQVRQVLRRERPAIDVAVRIEAMHELLDFENAVWLSRRSSEGGRGEVLADLVWNAIRNNVDDVVAAGVLLRDVLGKRYERADLTLHTRDHARVEIREDANLSLLTVRDAISSGRKSFEHERVSEHSPMRLLFDHLDGLEHLELPIDAAEEDALERRIHGVIAVFRPRIPVDQRGPRSAQRGVVPADERRQAQQDQWHMEIVDRAVLRAIARGAAAQLTALFWKRQAEALAQLTKVRGDLAVREHLATMIADATGSKGAAILAWDGERRQLLAEAASGLDPKTRHEWARVSDVDASPGGVVQGVCDRGMIRTFPEGQWDARDPDHAALKQWSARHGIVKALGPVIAVPIHDYRAVLPPWMGGEDSSTVRRVALIVFRESGSETYGRWHEDLLGRLIGLIEVVLETTRAMGAMHFQLATLAHQIRTPLLRARDYHIPTGKLDSAVAEINWTLNNVAAFTPRPAATAPEPIAPFPVHEVFRRADILTMFPFLEEKVRLLTDVPKDLPRIVVPRSSADRLRHVLLVIVANSERALRGRPNRCIEVRARASENSVCVSICDNGPGIAPEDLDRVTDPYFTRHASAGGSGLGLHIAKRVIVDECGGRLSVHSPRRDGSPGVEVEIELTAEREGQSQ